MRTPKITLGRAGRLGLASAIVAAGFVVVADDRVGQEASAKPTAITSGATFTTSGATFTVAAF